MEQSGDLGFFRLSSKAILNTVILCSFVGLGAASFFVGPPDSLAGTAEHSPQDTLSRYTETIEESLVAFDMVPVPGGEVTLQIGEDTQEVDVAPFWISTTEVTWDLYDIFAYQLDLEENERLKNADGKTRPSRPYQSPDYGYGHQGYAAICITYHAAEQFTVWLSEKTGKTYRLATDAEWQLAAQGGMSDGEMVEEDMLGEMAWYKENAEDKTQAVGVKQPNAIGAYDMLGNVLEWVTGHDGKPVTRGGSFKDPAEKVNVHARAKKHWKWNETDPQIPKSKWWLSDGYFVGFRIVRQP